MTEFSGIVTLDRDGAGRPTCLRAFTTGDTLASSVLTQNVTDTIDLVNLSSDNWDSTYFTVNDNSAAWGGGGVLYLTSVGDVTGPAVADQTIVYDGTEWQPTDYTLTALKDVTVTVGPAIDGYVLAWNNAGGYWEAVEQTGGGGATDLDDLTDVVVITPSINQVLYYTGSNWANATASHSWLTATGTNTHNQIDSKLTSLDACVITLDGRVDTLDACVITLDSDLTSLDACVITLDGRVDTLDACVITLDGRVDTLDACVITLDGRVDTLDACVITLDGRVDTLDACVIQLNNDLTSIELNDLNDVTITGTPADGQVLTYNNAGGYWEAQAAGTGGATVLDGLNDVVLTSPLSYHGLVYTGTQWENKQISHVWLTVTGTKSHNTIDTHIDNHALSADTYWNPTYTTVTNNSTNWTTAYTHSQVTNANPHTTKLTQLADVTPTTYATNQYLRYTGSVWQNSIIDHSHLNATGSNSHSTIDNHIANANIHFQKSEITLDDLGDVAITSPASNQVVRYSGGTWGNAQIVHSWLSLTGTKSHSVIDGELGYLATFSATTNNHINSTSNPHSVTAAQVGNTTAQWNASAMRGSALSSTLVPTTNQLLVYNGTVWTASTGPFKTTLGSLDDVTLATPVTNEFFVYNGTKWIDTTASHSWLTATGTNTHSQIDSHIGNVTGNPHNVNATQVGNDTAQWNADRIQNAEVTTPIGGPNGYFYYDAAAETFYVDDVIPLTGDQFVSYLASSFADASSLQGSPVSALLTPNEGDVLVFDPEAEVWTASAISLISTSVSSTNAFSSTYALSATSALNAQQAPNGFNVTGTVLATTVSATNYLNIRPNVSAVDSATTTTVNITGDYDLYLVNTSTTGVTLYLPPAASWNTKQITISKVEDSGSYRNVTVSSSELQTATNTVVLYDPTESVTVVSNGTNWYSLDYDRAYGVVVVCKNDTGATLTKGTPVRISGATGANILITATSAANNHIPDAPNGSLSRCIGVVEHDIPTGEFGHVLTKGILYKYNTSGYTEGDQLYLSPSGGFTNVKPIPPYETEFIGIVTRQQAINGSILIDIANPIHINDIVGFNLASGISNRDLIAYDLTTSTFKNYAPSSFNVSSATSATLAYSSTYALSSTSALNTQQAPNGFNVTGTLAATTVSATTYENLGNTVAKWNASAIRGIAVTNALPDEGNVLTYNAPNWVPAALPTSASTAVSATSAFSSTNAFSATNALSATSALNAQQAPNGFNVTGTLISPVVSATNVSATGTLISYTISAYDYLNIDHTTIGSIGSNSHDDIDNHINSTSNPHSVTAEQVGNTTAQWNASAIRGSALSATLVPTTGQSLVYNGTVWTASSVAGGGGGGTVITYGSGAPTGGSDGDVYLQTDVESLQIPSVSATTYLNLPSGTLTWTYATSATSALNAQQAPNGFSVTGNLTTTSGDVSAIRLTDYSESKSSPSISSSSLTLDLNAAQVFTVSLNSNISTLTINNTDSRANTVQGFTLILTADGTARTITWPGSVKWPGGTGPTLTSTNNKVDILSFVSPDNGTTWYGFTGGQNY